jgi:Na+-driven multidrug efflux pump
MGSAISAGVIGMYCVYKLIRGGWVVSFPRNQGWGPDWEIIKLLFKFGLPTGIQGIAMNVGGVLMLSFIGSVAQGAAAQAAFSISYSQLFSFITWTSVALMGAGAAMAGQNLGAGKPERAEKAVHMAAGYAAMVAAFVGILFLTVPRVLLGFFGIHDQAVLDIGAQLLRVLSVSGLFIAVALTYTGGLQGTGDTKSPLYISIVSQIVIPLSICFFVKKTSTLDPIDIWLAILAGHVARCTLSVLRFNQGEWRKIKIAVHHQPAKPA